MVSKDHDGSFSFHSIFASFYEPKWDYDVFCLGCSFADNLCPITVDGKTCHKKTYTYFSLDDRDLDEKMRDVFHNYLEERGISESLFPFLQAWLYVKEHRNLMRWFRTVGSFINENKNAKED